jgi:hypothetical protein
MVSTPELYCQAMVVYLRVSRKRRSDTYECAEPGTVVSHGFKDHGVEISWHLDLRDARAAGTCRSSDPLMLSVEPGDRGIPTSPTVGRATFPQLRRSS